MKIQVLAYESIKTDSACCLILPVVNGKLLADHQKALPQTTLTYFNTLEKNKSIPNKSGHGIYIPLVPGLKTKHILLIECGKKKTWSIYETNKWIGQLIGHLRQQTIKSFGIMHDGTAINTPLLLQQLLGTQISTDALKSKKKPADAWQKCILFCPTKEKKGYEQAAKKALALHQGMALTQYIADLPSNHCTPTFIAQQAQKLAKENKDMTCSVLSEADMKKLGMHCLLSVTAGSHQPAKMVLIHYKPLAVSKKKPYVLVGKGITFDSGGISLKPGARMDEMKYDMCGAASVLGTLKTIAELKPKLHVIGILVCAENMPGGAATKPGDIVSTLSGQTVEILNTDAEGRLVLCDALTYATRFKPEALIDIATLTGACIMALGHVAHGLMTNQDQLAQKLLKAGMDSHDRAWQLPLWDDYQQQINSNFADIANIGTPGAGTITAGCFLSRFTQDYPWAHLDIAGTAWRSGQNKGATGRCVPLLTEFLLQQAT